MPLNLSKIPPYILDDLQSRLNTDEEIRAMSADEAFDEWCIWNGIIGWADRLADALDGLREAEEE